MLGQTAVFQDFQHEFFEGLYLEGFMGGFILYNSLLQVYTYLITLLCLHVCHDHWQANIYGVSVEYPGK